MAAKQVAGSSAVKVFPAPSQLATPTDLNAQEVQSITDALNPIIADMLALYTKTKNYHWHLTGSHFREYHLLFDEQAATILASVDTLAERIRRVGGTTIRSISHVSQLQTIQDDNSEFVSPSDMMQRLVEDNQQITRAMRTAHGICERSHDVATASELEVLIDEAERRTWFLFEVMQGKEHMD